jgi:hypothetical protein
MKIKKKKDIFKSKGSVLKNICKQKKTLGKCLWKGLRKNKQFKSMILQKVDAKR